MKHALEHNLIKSPLEAFRLRPLHVLGNGAERDCIGLADRFMFSRTVSESAKDLWDFGDPATVWFALCFDNEARILSPRRFTFGFHDSLGCPIAE